MVWVFENIFAQGMHLYQKLAYTYKNQVLV